MLSNCCKEKKKRNAENDLGKDAAAVRLSSLAPSTYDGFLALLGEEKVLTFKFSPFLLRLRIHLTEGPLMCKFKLGPMYNHPDLCMSRKYISEYLSFPKS